MNKEEFELMLLKRLEKAKRGEVITYDELVARMESKKWNLN